MNRFARAIAALFTFYLAFSAGSALAANVYAVRGATNPGLVYQFGVGADANLSLLSPESVATGGYYAHKPGITPDGRHLYVDNTESTAMAQFGASAAGLLSPLSPATFTVAKGNYPVAVSPDGSSLYTAHTSPSALVEQLTIGSDGKLAQKTPATVPVEYVDDIVLSPDGRFLYVSNYSGTGRVFEYGVQADGTLKPLSPASVAAGSSPVGMAVSPDGRNLYVGTEGAAGVLQFTIGADGQLAPMVPPNQTLPEGHGAEEIVVSADGANLYAVASGKNGIVQMAIGAGGALSLLSPATVAAGTAVETVAVSPDARSVYAGLYDGERLRRYAVGAGGALTSTTNEFTQTHLVTGIAVSPDQGPTAALTVSTGLAGKPSAFDASGSSDPDGTVVRYDWSFGDGATETTSAPTTSHVFAHRGVYHATVTVTDDEGGSTTRVFTGHQVLRNGSAAAKQGDTFKVFGRVPELSKATLKPRRFQVGKGAHRGTRLRFRLDVAGVVTEKVERRRHGKWVPLKGNVLLHGKAKANRFAFSGRFKGKELKPGSYRLVLTPRSEGQAGRPARLRFTVLAG